MVVDSPVRTKVLDTSIRELRDGVPYCSKSRGWKLHSVNSEVIYPRDTAEIVCGFSLEFERDDVCGIVFPSHYKGLEMVRGSDKVFSTGGKPVTFQVRNRTKRILRVSRSECVGILCLVRIVK